MEGPWHIVTCNLVEHIVELRGCEHESEATVMIWVKKSQKVVDWHVIRKQLIFFR